MREGSPNGKHRGPRDRIAKRVLTPSDERERRQRLRGQPYSEGTWKLDGRFVKISASFYPKVAWWLEECTRPGEVVQGSKRKLTPEEGARLEAWL